MKQQEAVKRQGYYFSAVRNVLLGAIFLTIISFGNFALAQEDSFLKTKVEKINKPVLNNSDRIKQVLRNFDVPKEIGIIKEIYVPKNPSEQLILNIQDLHCNYEAQRNIAKILEYLIKTYQLKLISVEGGSGRIDTTFYKQLPDDKVKEQVADYFLKEARINGTEYFAINTKDDIALYGAEDQKYYDKNLEAFLKALPKREKILENIAVLENDLNILKNRIYNKKLNELDDNVVAYQNGAMQFEDYIHYISGLYPKDKLKAEFPQVQQLLESIELKRNLDLAKAESQRKELIDFLTKNLARSEMEEFLKITMEFKTKTEDALTYHNALKNLYDKVDKKEKTLNRAWPELNRYIEYLNKHETLDKFALFNEIDTLIERIKAGIYTSLTQKNLDHFLATIRLARNLFATKLLNKDLPYMKKYRSDFNSEKITKFISGEAKRLNIDLPIPADLSELEKNLPILEDFYYYASQRNNILIGNTMKYMAEQKECIGILVTGGFHTEGMTDFLKEKRINYIVVVPKVEKLDESDTRYINALQGKKTPFEEQLEKEEKQPAKK